MKRYPDSLNALGAFAGLACRAEDWETARQLFEQIGDRVELKTWKNKAEFVAFRNQAYKERRSLRLNLFATVAFGEFARLCENSGLNQGFVQSH